MTNSSTVQIDNGVFINPDKIDGIDIKLDISRHDMSLYVVVHFGSRRVTVKTTVVTVIEVFNTYAKDGDSLQSVLLPETPHFRAGLATNVYDIHRYNICAGSDFLETVDLRIIFDAVSSYLSTQILSFANATTLSDYLAERFVEHDECKLWLENTKKGFIKALKPEGVDNG